MPTETEKREEAEGTVGISYWKDLFFSLIMAGGLGVGAWFGGEHASWTILGGCLLAFFLHQRTLSLTDELASVRNRLRKLEDRLDQELPRGSAILEARVQELERATLQEKLPPLPRAK